MKTTRAINRITLVVFILKLKRRNDIRNASKKHQKDNEKIDVKKMQDYNMRKTAITLPITWMLSLPMIGLYASFSGCKRIERKSLK